MNRPVAFMALCVAVLTLAIFARPAGAQEQAQVARCNSEGAQKLRGVRYTADVAKTVQEITGAAAVRVTKIGEPRTMDYSSGRVNVELDQNGMIKDVRCG